MNCSKQNTHDHSHTQPNCLWCLKAKINSLCSLKLSQNHFLTKMELSLSYQDQFRITASSLRTKSYVIFRADCRIYHWWYVINRNKIASLIFVNRRVVINMTPRIVACFPSNSYNLTTSIILWLVYNRYNLKTGNCKNLPLGNGLSNRPESLMFWNGLNLWLKMHRGVFFLLNVLYWNIIYIH